MLLYMSIMVHNSETKLCTQTLTLPTLVGDGDDASGKFGGIMLIGSENLEPLSVRRFLILSSCVNTHNTKRWC